MSDNQVKQEVDTEYPAYLDDKAAGIAAASYGSDYDAEPAIKALLREAFSRGQRAARLSGVAAPAGEQK